VIGVAGALSTRRFQGIEGGQLSVLVAERRMDERGRTKGPQPALLPLMSQAPGQAACAGMSDLFVIGALVRHDTPLRPDSRSAGRGQGRSTVTGLRKVRG
jgi:hypothetical protein